MSVAFQNIVIIKVVSVILGLGFTIIPFKGGLEFILLKRNKEEMFMIEVTSVMLAGSSLVILIIMQKFIAMFCQTDKDEDMEIGILMLILAFVSCCLSAFVVIARYIG